MGFCTKCGAPLDADDLFCGNCGAQVVRKEPAAGQQSAPQDRTGQQPTAQQRTVQFAAGGQQTQQQRPVRQPAGQPSDAVLPQTGRYRLTVQKKAQLITGSEPVRILVDGEEWVKKLIVNGYAASPVFTDTVQIQVQSLGRKRRELWLLVRLTGDAIVTVGEKHLNGGGLFVSAIEGAVVLQQADAQTGAFGQRTPVFPPGMPRHKLTIESMPRGYLATPSVHYLSVDGKEGGAFGTGGAISTFLYSDRAQVVLKCVHDGQNTEKKMILQMDRDARIVLSESQSGAVFTKYHLESKVENAVVLQQESWTPWK